MEEFVARPQRWKLALAVLWAIVMVAAGLWLVGAFGDPLSSGRHDPALNIFMGWAAILFFGFCAVAGFLQLFETEDELRINAHGIRWTSWSPSTIPWSQIAGVGKLSFQRQHHIVLLLNNPSQFPGAGIATSPSMTAINRKFIGGDIVIPLSDTDRTLDEALAAINAFRPRANRV